MTLYLEIDDFETLYDGVLDDAQEQQAELLLQVVDARIRQLKPDADANAAKQVAFEVVRDAILYGPLEKLSEFQNITSRRTEAGTFDEAMKMVNDYLNDRQKRVLGIALRAAPVYSFPVCDY